MNWSAIGQLIQFCLRSRSYLLQQNMSKDRLCVSVMHVRHLVIVPDLLRLQQATHASLKYLELCI